MRPTPSSYIQKSGHQALVINRRTPFANTRLLIAILVGISVITTDAENASVQPPIQPTLYEMLQSCRPDPSYYRALNISSHYNEYRPLGPFFLPQPLPVLGVFRPIDPTPLVNNYPCEIAGEPYFIAYGNLAARKLLSPERTKRIERYKTEHASLLAVLRKKLKQVQGETAEIQQRTLAELAATQTPELLKLENEAEDLRRDLTYDSPWRTSASDIGKLVVEHAPADRRPSLAKLWLTLSAAHFRDGFSPEQRHLLEEMAHDLSLILEPEPNASAQPWVFFWPAGTRILKPSGLPPEAAAKFDNFQQQKEALKEELRTVLNRGDSYIFTSQRTDCYSQLAAKQAQRFVELDALADQLRPALAALTEATTQSSAALPSNLADELTAIVNRKAVLQRELYAKLMQFRRDLPDDRIELTGQKNGLAITVVSAKGNSHKQKAARAHINAYNEDLLNRFNALSTDRDAVLAAIVRYQSAAQNAKPGLTVDQLVADFLNDYKAWKNRQQQSDYAAAVLAPGLSPAQRRLLLNATLVDLLLERFRPAP